MYSKGMYVYGRCVLEEVCRGICGGIGKQMPRHARNQNQKLAA